MRPRNRRGTISVEMTADEVIAAAANLANGWSLDDVGYGSAENADALREMLAEVFEQIVRANREAVRQRPEGRAPDGDQRGVKARQPHN